MTTQVSAVSTIPEELPSTRDVLLQVQRDANEALVLTALRANEAADDAVIEQHRAQDESMLLRTREGEYILAAQFRERLLGIVGHDLRNPLNTMLMASALMIAHGNLSEADARLADRILGSGRRMARMITQLMEFTRARLGGGFSLELLPSDLAGICDDIASELRVGSLVEVVHLATGDLAGTWDADRLSQAISNVAGNAVQHATPGTKVQMHAFADGDIVVVEVTNQGTPIPADVLPELFDAFRQGSAPASGNREHLGLGLYIASEIVKAHGGTIGAGSAEGTTKFTIRLPRVVPSR